MENNDNTTQPIDSSYIAPLPFNVSSTISKVKEQYNELDEVGKEAVLCDLTGWLVKEKGIMSWNKSKDMK